MKENQVVVVFPSIFSVNKIELLMSNLKKILKIRNQKFRSVNRDGSIIVINTSDPVMVSSAINSLFGIERIVIAKKNDNKFDSVVSGIVKTGSSLLLENEKFFVKVEGESINYLPVDAQVSATSGIIEKTANMGVKPGTEKNHDRMIYAYITKKNAYVSIFSDDGYGGVPYNVQKAKIVCCVFDEFSAISCLQTIKMGFDVKILICYRNEQDLLMIVKMMDRILYTIVQPKIQLEFFKVPIDTDPRSYFVLVNVITEILSYIAKASKIKRVSLAISPLIFPAWFLENTTNDLTKQGLIPWIPLSGIDQSIFDTANELGLEKFVAKIPEICKLGNKKKIISKSILLKKAKDAIKTRKKLGITLGPLNVHIILDSLSR